MESMSHLEVEALHQVPGELVKWQLRFLDVAGNDFELVVLVELELWHSFVVSLSPKPTIVGFGVSDSQGEAFDNRLVKPPVVKGKSPVATLNLLPYLWMESQVEWKLVVLDGSSRISSRNVTMTAGVQ